MLKRLISVPLIFSILLLFNSAASKAQCPVGWTAAQTNWDWLDYLITGGNYAPTGNYPGVPAALAATQAYAIGSNRFTIAYAGGIACTLGENNTNTAEAGSFGAGADVQYANNGTVTVTFDTLVKNVRFSLYDIDLNQTTQVTASDGVTPLAVTMNIVTAGTLAVVGSPGLAPLATANAVAVANNNTQGTLNIAIPGGANGVKSFVITIGGTAGDWWLSDINACVYRTFATNYFTDAKPFTGQATYVLATPDSNSVSYIDTATGKAKFLFSGNLSADANAPKFLNALGYDHKKHYVYYVHDFGNKAYNTRTLRRWDYNTESIDATMAIDVNTLGIPTFDGGVESAGCAFYDGSLYFGIEGNNSSNNSNRETIIWRIDFNSSNVPIKSCQVWATPADNGGGTRLHDWNDFQVHDGILYNFDGAGSTSQDDYYHFDMQTGVMLQDYTGMQSHNTPRQAAVTWAGTLYWVYDSIGVYNGTGGVGPKTKITGTSLSNFSPDWAVGTIIGSTKGNSGDAAGPFKPKTDFGDAPATYDPGPGDPATHDKDSLIRIGSTFDREWATMPSVLADGDGADEDGLSFVPILNPGYGNYLAQVSVYNHTGANATLIAWLDYNGNGVFDASEACNVVTVASSTSSQLKYLYWPSAPTSLPNGSYTYLRIRITSTANGMAAANPTGYYNNGEVEDYRVLVDNYPLSTQLFSFDAHIVNNNAVLLSWTSNEDVNTPPYEIQRSANGSDWQHVDFIAATGKSGQQNHDYTDVNPLKGLSYYRLKFNGDKYSNIKSVRFKDLASYVSIFPNPATEIVNLKIENEKETIINAEILNTAGHILFQQQYQLMTGVNRIVLPLDNYPSGTYFLHVRNNEGEVVNKKFVIKK